MDLDAIAGLPMVLQFAAVLGLIIGTVLAQAALRWYAERGGQAPAKQADVAPIGEKLDGMTAALALHSGRIEALEASDVEQSAQLQALTDKHTVLTNDVRALLEYCTNGSTPKPSVQPSIKPSAKPEATPKVQ